MRAAVKASVWGHAKNIAGRSQIYIPGETTRWSYMGISNPGLQEEYFASMAHSKLAHHHSRPEASPPQPWAPAELKLTSFAQATSWEAVRNSNHGR